MHLTRIRSRFAVAAFTCACWASVAVAQTGTADTMSIVQPPSEGFTLPSQEAKVTAPTPALVEDVPVKEGDHVKAGQVLLVQDRRVEQKLLEIYQTEADSRVRVEASEADRDVKREEFERIEKLFKEGGSTLTEMERARLEWVLSEKNVGAAELEHEKNRLEAQSQGLKIARMEILSPIDGIVERLEVAKGEVTDPQRPVIHVVLNDPLKVEIHLLPEQAARLKLGDKVQVKYRDLGDATWYTAEVSFLSPMADSKSNTRRVNLLMPNPTNRESGLWVIARLPEAAGGGPESAGTVLSGQ
jgi:RND family efflux transporter MFP subunit